VTVGVCVCVCVRVYAGGTSRNSTTKKEAVFRNFDMTYLPCCFHPPPRPDIPYDEESPEGRV
jgi:hypothetical protein